MSEGISAFFSWPWPWRGPPGALRRRRRPRGPRFHGAGASVSSSASSSVSRSLIWFAADLDGRAGSASGGGGGANSRLPGFGAAARRGQPCHRRRETPSEAGALARPEPAAPPPFIRPPSAPKPSGAARRRCAVVGAAIDRAGALFATEGCSCSRRFVLALLFGRSRWTVLRSLVLFRRCLSRRCLRFGHRRWRGGRLRGRRLKRLASKLDRLVGLEEDLARQHDDGDRAERGERRQRPSHAPALPE